MTADFFLNMGSFSATSVELTAVSDEGKAKLGEMFGVGAASATFPKSRGWEVEEYLSKEGFKVDIWTPL